MTWVGHSFRPFGQQITSLTERATPLTTSNDQAQNHDSFMRLLSPGGAIIPSLPFDIYNRASGRVGSALS